MKFNNKAQAMGVGALGGLAIVLVVAAIIISVGAEILDNVQGQSSPESRLQENITFTAAADEANVAITGFNSPQTLINGTLVLYNISDGACGATYRDTPMGVANYTLNVANNSVYIGFNDTASGIYLNWSTGLDLCGSYDLTYYETAQYNVTQGGLEGTEIFGDWLDTIALIIVAAVVIGIIASSFGRQK